MLTKIKLLIARLIFGDMNKVRSDKAKGFSIDMIVFVKLFLFQQSRMMFNSIYRKTKKVDAAVNIMQLYIITLTSFINALLLLSILVLLSFDFKNWLTYLYLFAGLLIVELYIFSSLKNAIIYLKSTISDKSSMVYRV